MILRKQLGRLCGLQPAVARRSLTPSAEIDKSVAELLKPPSRILTPAETAYAHRLGVADLQPEVFRSALSHPKLPQSRKRTEFPLLNELGGEVLDLFVRDYVNARFPKLPRDSHELAVKVYTTTKNLSAVARSTGVEYAVINFTGIPNIVMPTLETHCGSASAAQEGRVAVPPTKVYADIFKAIIGATFREKGALATRSLLDALLFSGTFNKDLLCRPRNPMLKLAHAMRSLRMAEPAYRLLHETGRLSDTSIYVVGVYSGTDKLAEAHGPSMLAAQERAAIEALRDLFLADTPRAPRRSDVLMAPGAPSVNKRPQLAKILAS